MPRNILRIYSEGQNLKSFDDLFQAYESMAAGIEFIKKKKKELLKMQLPWPECPVFPVVFALQTTG